MAHSVRWRIISEQDTNGFSKLFVCLLKGISTVLPVKPLQFDVEKPPVVDPKIVFFPMAFPMAFCQRKVHRIENGPLWTSYARLRKSICSWKVRDEMTWR